NEKKEPVLSPGSKWIIHPYAQRKIKWDLMIAVLIVYSTLTVPFRIGFDQEAGLFGTIIDIVVDVAFFLDIVTNFRTAIIDENGEPVVRSKEICRKYLKGWFFIDFLSTVPIDTLAKSEGDPDSAVFRSTKLLRIMRLVRLLKLVRLFKL
ncbi:unnamed protein product, partial [Choristocarpus tenellus]